MAKWLAMTFGILLIVTNGFWLYSAIDLAVTEKYRQQVEYENENKIIALTKLTNNFVKGMEKNELKELLGRLFPDFEPFEKEGAINTIWLSFKISPDGKIEPNEVSQ